MTARGELFDALFYARVTEEKAKPLEEQQAADSTWVRQQQGDITRLLNRYDHEQAERVRYWGNHWSGESAVVFFVVADKLDPEANHA